MYEQLKYKDYVELYSYYYTPTNSRGDSTIYSVDYSGVTRRSYIGNVNSEEYYNTILNNKSWLDDYYASFVPVSYYSYSGYTGFKYILNCKNENLITNPDVRANNYLTDTFDNYIPVITLKQNLEIIKDTSCSSTYTPGSINCPYLLKDNDGNILR